MGKRKTRKTRPKPKEGLHRPFADGQWTEARFRSFVKSALRGARWPSKYECIRKAFIKRGPNPKTGRMCKLHQCEECEQIFPQNQIQADHIEPVIGPEGFVSWDVYIKRLFVNADGFRALCKGCHEHRTMQDRFGVGPEEARIMKKVVEFGKLPAQKQKNLLRQLKLREGANAAERKQIYKTHLEK